MGIMHQFSVYQERRKRLLEHLKKAYPSVECGAIMLFGACESGRVLFRQDSSFYYFTGIEEPAVILVIDFSGKTTLFVPQFKQNRAAWVMASTHISPEKHDILCDQVVYLGGPVAGYQMPRGCDKESYRTVIQLLEKLYREKGSLFVAWNEDDNFFEQKYKVECLRSLMGGSFPEIRDISATISFLRREKDREEIECIVQAIEITRDAQEAAAQTINIGINEAEVQAAIEFVITSLCARPSFPSIVGSGMRSTVLHYHNNNNYMEAGELVVVDIGAEYGMYCADITRTYPVSGRFSARQRELYSLVLEVQEFIAQRAQPGWWLSNAQYPDKSLNHCARKFLAQRGYEEYFIHGIGHYLGLDVHDVGNYSDPLAEGDVITIEPGIYIPGEATGIRVEDNYWIVKNGAVCLSESIPKSIEAIEALMEESRGRVLMMSEDRKEIAC